MSGALHILQRWAQSTGFDGEPITTLAQVEELCAEAVRQGARLCTITSRCPRRDVTGGSVYFLSPKRTVEFRLPLIEIVGRDVAGGSDFLFALDPAGFARVEPRHVRFLRGWRYLTDAPPDLPNNTDELPEHMRRELRELGL